MSDYYARRASEKCDSITNELRDQRRLRDADMKSINAMFTRMAQQIDSLSKEVRQLREELNPKKLDKPKLRSPQQRGQEG